VSVAPVVPPRKQRRISSDDALRLWQQYRETNDKAIRDRLVLTFAPLVKYIVYKKVREMPARCEVEDFISCGLEALIQSIDRYDPAKGATLEQYAWTRIHGAVLDELRRQDWAPRSVRRWERDMDKAADQFTSLHGRRPTTAELADALGVKTDELRRKRDEVMRSDMTSLNTLVLSDDETTIERIDTVASTDVSVDPVFSAAKDEAKAKFRAAFAALPQREREVAVLLYVKHLTLAEIGEILGVSESRVCQIHGALKRTLRAALSSDEQLFQLVA
jgi:RNA polymerase sigma factor for flagellar operon FliA